MLHIGSSNPELWRVLYARDPEVALEAIGGVEHKIRFTLGLGRRHARHLGVELTAIVEDIPWLERQSLVVTYRIFFEIVGEATDEELSETLRNLGTRVGPSMLFPFVREQVFSMTGASGRSLLLPLVDWDNVFEEYNMPEPDAQAPEEFLRPVD